jgi:hypothetical protein
LFSSVHEWKSAFYFIFAVSGVFPDFWLNFETTFHHYPLVSTVGSVSSDVQPSLVSFPSITTFILPPRNDVQTFAVLGHFRDGALCGKGSLLFPFVFFSQIYDEII